MSTKLCGWWVGPIWKQNGETCGWWVGPIWKQNGETCVCCLEPNHDAAHKCTCGAWFEGCGHPPQETK